MSVAHQSSYCQICNGCCLQVADRSAVQMRPTCSCVILSRKTRRCNFWMMRGSARMILRMSAITAAALPTSNMRKPAQHHQAVSLSTDQTARISEMLSEFHHCLHRVQHEQKDCRTRMSQPSDGHKSLMGKVWGSPKNSKKRHSFCFRVMFRTTFLENTELGMVNISRSKLRMVVRYQPTSRTMPSTDCRTASPSSLWCHKL